MLQKFNYRYTSECLPMHNSQAKGIPLVKDSSFGADMLWFKSWEATATHTHFGDHILYVVSGDGTLVFDGVEYDLECGDCYLVPGSIPHQVKAKAEGMYLLSVANNHQHVNGKERSQVV